jgi:Zn ribbon nucleic-acid-binding protein
MVNCIECGKRTKNQKEIKEQIKKNVEDYYLYGKGQING